VKIPARCPRCHTEPDKGDKYCSNCGKNLRHADKWQFEELSLSADADFPWLLPHGATTPVDEVTRRRLLTATVDAFSQLSEIEQQILIRRFALDDGHFRTWKEIGDDCGASATAVSERASTALRKIRLHIERIVLDQVLRS
jgi:DNA-directed RNA polymerase sigma subunit (sigma70/sigma32)